MLKVRCPQQRGLGPEVIRDVYDGKEYTSDKPNSVPKERMCLCCSIQMAWLCLDPQK